MSLNIDCVRSQFPSLALGYIFADNAGGSQVIGNVISKISDQPKRPTWCTLHCKPVSIEIVRILISLITVGIHFVVSIN
jgi:hypothetical protein